MGSLKSLKNGKKKAEIEEKNKLKIKIKKVAKEGRSKRSPPTVIKKCKNSSSQNKTIKKVGRSSSKANKDKGHKLVAAEDEDEEGEDSDETMSLAETSDSDWEQGDSAHAMSDTETDVEDEVSEDDEEEEPIKKKPKSEKSSKKNQKNKSNYCYDEPQIVNKIELIDMPRKKQMQIFDQSQWNIAKAVRTAEIDIDKWMEHHSTRDSYFFGEDEVREK